MTQKASRFRLMTYNVGGGRSSTRLLLPDIAQAVREVDPDILALQEATGWIDAEGREHALAHDVALELGIFKGVYYGPTYSMRENFHVGKRLFVDAVFNDYQDWSQGNALLSRWDFARLSDTSKSGTPRNIALFQPVQYEGNRDTDPRKAILARIKDGTLFPFVINTHLTVLVGERGDMSAEPPVILENPVAMRHQQIRNLLSVIQGRLLSCHELVFLMGDFNADEGERCLQELGQAGFTRLTPTNRQTPTHLPGGNNSIDHIFVYPDSRLVQFDCRIIDSPLARRASDHLPVVADIVVGPS